MSKHFISTFLTMLSNKNGNYSALEIKDLGLFDIS